MKFGSMGNFWNTIRFKLVIGVLIFLIPFFLLLAYNNFYTVKVVRKQVAASNKNVVSLYLKQIDNNLEDTAKYLADLAGMDGDLAIIENAPDIDDRVLAERRLKNKMAKDIVLYKSIDTIFIYSIPMEHLIMESNDSQRTEDVADINKYILDLMKKSYDPEYRDKELLGLQTEKWYVENVNGTFYLFRLLRKANIYFGALVRAERLLVPLNEKNFGSNSISLFVTSSGEPMNNKEFVTKNGIDLTKQFQDYYITGSNHDFLIVGEKFSQGDFSMVAITPDIDVFSASPYLKQIITLVAICSIIVMPIYLIILRRTLLAPLRRILQVMKKIRKGDMDVRIDPFKTSEEFQIVNEAFNDMVNQIHKLKIDIYEEKISRQKAELEHLQLQVKPHFYLNSLNIINTLARSKKYELLREMSQCLIEYFRYMFKSDTTFVQLGDELRHVRNYIRIQQMRFPQSLTTEIDVPEYLLSAPIPPLIIHTFVENTIKHSVTLDDQIHLVIKASIFGTEAMPGMRIIISDTGKGFKEEILNKLRSGERIIDKLGEHIGIRNVQRRLMLIYGGRAKLTCRNGNDGGAIIDILLPLEIEKRSERLDTGTYS